MATMTLATESRQNMTAQMVMNRIATAGAPIVNVAKKIAIVFDTQSLAVVFFSGLLTFLAFVFEMAAMGGIAGIVFMLSLRPFATRGIGEVREVRD